MTSPGPLWTPTRLLYDTRARVGAQAKPVPVPELVDLTPYKSALIRRAHTSTVDVMTRTYPLRRLNPL